MDFGIIGRELNYVASVGVHPIGRTAEDINNEVSGEALDTVVKESDGFQKSSTWKPDTETIDQMKADLQANISSFRLMVRELVERQGGYVDALTQQNAQAAISDDGTWGVDATATRILDYAKALAGDDPEKLELLEGAVMDGFAAAERAWGGALPGISYQTRDRILEGFSEWRESLGLVPGEAADTDN